MSSPEVPPMPKDVLFRLVVGSTVRVVLGLAFIFVALALVPVRPDGTVAFPILLALAGSAFYLWFFARQISRIRTSRYPYVKAAEAMILVAAMFLAVFSAFYVVISTDDPASFTEPLTHFSAYYFALTVLATVGFGDITPVSVLARATTMVQMAIGIAFVAIIVRVIFSTARQSAERKAAPAGPASGHEA